MKPLIGLTSNYAADDNLLKLNQAYCHAVNLSGGIPLVLSYSEISLQEYITIFDGILFTGGGDIDPFYFQQAPHPSLGSITPERDQFELALCRLALQKKMPILAICRGMQILNVAAGGSIFQDISAYITEPIKHSQLAPKYYASHSIFLKESTYLKKLFQSETLMVNSFHHQSVNITGEDLIVCAQSSDGVIEAIEHSKNQFALGVQWHPECMFEKDSHQLIPFQAFVEACKK